MPHEGFFIYAEDDPDAVFLVRSVLRRLNAEEMLVHCVNGLEVIGCLQQNFEAGRLPRFVLLDLRMPKMDGLETLRWIKRTSPFSGISVVMTSTSNLTSDIQLAMTLGAADYLVKPTHFAQLTRMVTLLLERFSLV